MTRPETRTKAGQGADSGARKSTRAKVAAAEMKASKAKKAAPTKSIKTPKSKTNVVDSDDDDEEEEEEQEKLTKSSRQIPATTTTKKSARGGAQSASASAPAPKKPVKNGVKAPKKTAPTPIPSDDEEDEDEKDGDGDDENQEQEDEDEEDDDDEDEEEVSSSSEEDDGSDFEEPTEKRKAAKAAAAAAKKSRQAKASAASSRIPVIKPRKSRAKAPKEPKLAKASTGEARKRKSLAVTATFQENAEGEEEDDEEESALYSAVLDSQVALETVVADWIALYERSSAEAMLNLTNFLIRCCGCKQFISAEEFGKQGKMVQTLKNMLLRYKENTANFDYPIVSKVKKFKKFKKNLLEFYSRLIQKAQGDVLFDGKFMDTLLNWTISLSSSTFRPVRHTAAAVALNIVSSLAEISTELQEELDVTNRQLATSQKQKAAQSKIKQLERKVAQGQHRKADTLKWIKDIFDSVYVLRCRDVDPLVRSDCIHELGQWMVLNPDQFITSSFMHYLGWALSDKTAAVRLEALKVLTKLYEIENQPNALRQFTMRYTERFIDMAMGESDTAARLGAIRVATLVHKHGQLEEDEQAKLSTLVFGANAKVRKSLAKFVKARVWEDEVEGRMAACELLASSQTEKVEFKKDWVELKSLVSFLIKVGKSEEESESLGHDDERAHGAGTRLFDETKVGRNALAVEALWSEIEALKNWKAIAEYLLEDHTKAPELPSSQRGGKTKPATLEESYHLEEEEENVLLEVFIASLQLTLKPPAVPGFQKEKIKAQLDDLANEVGRYCLDIMPRLFSKYGVDATRIRFVLVIPQLIPLNVYLDMRMITAYEELVDDVIKVFKKHSDPSVLSAAAVTLRTMLGCEILRTSHEAKIEALGVSIVDSFLILASQAEDFDVSDRTTLDELTLCLRRFEHLIKCTDVTVQRTRSTGQDPFDAFLKVIQRYKTVRDEDAEILISSLSTSFLWISWVCRAYVSKYDQNADWTENDVQDLLYKQESLVQAVSDLAVKESQEIDTRVRRRAFQILGDIYWLFGGDMFHSSKGANRHMLHMTCPETTQTECENFVRMELDLWDEKVQEKVKSLQEARRLKVSGEAAEGEDGSDREDDEKAREDAAEILEDERLAAAQIEQEDKYEMFGTVFSFMRQIMLKDFNMGHATAVLAWYGHFGAEYDEGVKRVVASIKAQTSEGLSKHARDLKTETFMSVCLDSLKESFDIYMRGRVHSNSQAIQLAKVLSTAISPIGFMRSTRVGIESRFIWDLHRRAVVYVLEKIAGCDADAEGQKKRVKMINFFELLGHMPFGTLSATNNITAIQELIQAECDRNELDIAEEEEDLWEPLRSYQAKLEKLVVRAAAEQAAAAKRSEDAARVREEERQREEEQQQQQEEEEQGQPQQTQGETENDGQRDVDMENVDVVTAAHTRSIEGSVPVETAGQEKSSGKKRQADDDDEDDVVVGDGREGSDEADSQRPSRAESPVSGTDDDEAAEGQSSNNEAKRIRVR